MAPRWAMPGFLCLTTCPLAAPGALSGGWSSLFPASRTSLSQPTGVSAAAWLSPPFRTMSADRGLHMLQRSRSHSSSTLKSGGAKRQRPLFLLIAANTMVPSLNSLSYCCGESDYNGWASRKLSGSNCRLDAAGRVVAVAASGLPCSAGDSDR